jgi:hypothetical protein
MPTHALFQAGFVDLPVKPDVLPNVGIPSDAAIGSF